MWQTVTLCLVKALTAIFSPGPRLSYHPARSGWPRGLPAHKQTSASGLALGVGSRVSSCWGWDEGGTYGFSTVGGVETVI